MALHISKLYGVCDYAVIEVSLNIKGWFRDSVLCYLFVFVMEVLMYVAFEFSCYKVLQDLPSRCR